MFMQLPNGQLFRWMEKDRYAEGFLCVANFILDLPGDLFANAVAFQVGIVGGSLRSKAGRCLYECRKRRANTMLVAKKAEVCFVSNTFAL